MHKKRNTIMAVLAVVLVAALTIGGTLAYMTDSESLLNKFTVGDLDVEFKEPNYPTDCDTDDRVPGDSFPKDPTITLKKGRAYMRVVVEFIDTATGAAITGDRLAKIQKTLYYDKLFNNPAPGGGYKGSNLLRLWAGGGAHTPNALYHYDEAYLSALPASQFSNWFNTWDFEADARSANGVYYLNYKNTTTNDILDINNPVQIFTSVVFPKNWNQNDLNLLGNYSIRMTVQVIQAQGFRDRAEAFAALDQEIADGTLLVGYTGRP